MSYIIKATPSELRNAAANVEDNAEQIRSEVENVRTLLDQLRQTFLGERASDFFNRYETAYQDMQRWDDIVRSFSDEMREAANRLEAADRN